MGAELTEQDIIDMKKGFKDMQTKISSLDFSKIPTKEEVEICIGGHCETITKGLEKVEAAQGSLTDKVTHLDEVVHNKYRPPSQGIHEATKRKTAQPQDPAKEDDKHSHQDMKAMADCPDCYKGMKEAVEPKLLAEGYHKEVFKMTEQQRKAIKGKGIPTCDGCGVPWVDDEEGQHPDKCVNCGEGE